MLRMVRPSSKSHAARPAHLRQTFREDQGVTALVLRGMQRAGQLVLHMGQRRLHLDAGIHADGAHARAVIVEHGHVGDAGLVVGRVAEQKQAALVRLLMIGEAGVAPQRVEQAQAVEAELQLDDRVVLVALGGAVGEEAQAPTPHADIRAQMEAQRGVAAVEGLAAGSRVPGARPRHRHGRARSGRHWRSWFPGPPSRGGPRP